MKLPQLLFMLFSVSTAIFAAAKRPRGLMQRSIAHTDYDKASTPSAFATTSRLTARASSEWKKKMKQKLKQCVACGAPPGRAGTSRGQHASPARAITGGGSPPAFLGASTSRSRRASPNGSGSRSPAAATLHGASTSRGRTSLPPCGSHRSPSPQRQGSPTPPHTVASPDANPSRGAQANRITMHNPDLTLPRRVDLRLVEGEYAVPYLVCPQNEPLHG